MAARLPRRSFASPFVVTLAATVPACFVESNPRPAPPPQPTTRAEPAPQPAPPQPPPVVIANPPRPTPVEPAPAPQPTKPPIVIANPPRPTPVDSTPPPTKGTPPTRKPPTTTGATEERRWYVTRAKGTCTAQSASAGGCPHPATGPIPPCNPPPPLKVACPDRTTDGESFTLVQHVGETMCTVVDPPSTCPQGATCNPPPPRRGPCP